MVNGNTICVRCHKPIAGVRLIGHGVNTQGVRVCGFCTTDEEHDRALARSLQTQGDDVPEPLRKYLED